MAVIHIVNKHPVNTSITDAAQKPKKENPPTIQQLNKAQNSQKVLPLPNQHLQQINTTYHTHTTQPHSPKVLPKSTKDVIVNSNTTKNNA